jgi:hypothetical protein
MTSKEIQKLIEEKQILTKQMFIKKTFYKIGDFKITETQYKKFYDMYRDRLKCVYQEYTPAITTTKHSL